MKQQNIVNIQLEILKELRAINSEMGVQTIAVLFQVAKNEGTGVMQIAEALDISGASASRNVSVLSKMKQHGVKGYGLVTSDYDIHERRRKIVTLTPAGRCLMKRFADICNDADFKRLS